MKISKKIAIIISCVFVFMGIVCIMVGKVNGGSLLFHVDYQKHEVSSGKDKQKMVVKNYSLEDTASIELNLDCSDLKLEEGDEFKITYICLDDDVLTVSNEDKVTIIKEETCEKNSGIGIHIEWFGMGSGLSDDREVLLTIPKGKKFEQFTVTSSCGDVSFKELETDCADITLDCGELNGTFAKDVEKSKIHVKYGDCKVSFGGNCGETDMLSDSGDIHVTYTGEAGISKIASNYGDMNVTFNGNAKETSIESDCGDVNMTVYGKKEDYQLDVRSECEFSIDGDEFESEHYTSGGTGANKMSVKMEYGELDLNFKS